jgi:hypothetical protein
MAARLSAPTRLHNSSPRDKSAIDRRTPVTASLVGCNVRLDGRANELSPSVCRQQPCRTNRPQERRGPDSAVQSQPGRRGTNRERTPQGQQRHGGSDGRALWPTINPRRSFLVRARRCRHRRRAAVRTQPVASLRAATCSHDPHGRLSTRASWLPLSCASSSIGPRRPHGPDQRSRTDANTNLKSRR